MENNKIIKFSQIFFLFLVIAWFFVPLDDFGKLAYLGFLLIYLALHNLLGFKLDRENKAIMRKYIYFQKKFGEVWGTRVYLLAFILLPFLLGLFILANSYFLK